MNITENREFFPVNDGVATIIKEAANADLNERSTAASKGLAFVGLAAAAVAGALTFQGGNKPPEAHALINGDVASQPTGRLGRLVGTQALRLTGEHFQEVDSQMIDHYDRTCQFAINPWDNWTLIESFGQRWKANRIYTQMGRTGSSILKKDPYLKRHGGITIRVPKCDGDPKERTSSQLPLFEPVAFIGVKDFDKEAERIRERTQCTKFDRAYWDYRVHRSNRSYFDFRGITITIPLFDGFAPASLGLRIRFSEKTTLRFPVCGRQKLGSPRGVPTIPARAIGFRDLREEYGG